MRSGAGEKSKPLVISKQFCRESKVKRNIQSNHDYPKFKVQLQLTGLPRKSFFDFQRSNFSEVVSWCCVNIKTAVELLTPVIIEDVCDYLKKKNLLGI